jgi:hypothetical protein
MTLGAASAVIPRVATTTMVVARITGDPQLLPELALFRRRDDGSKPGKFKFL